MALSSEAASLQAHAPRQLLQPPPSLWQATLTDPAASLGGPIQTQQQQALLQSSQQSYGGPAAIVHLGCGNVQQVQETPISAGRFAVTLPMHAHQDSLQAPAFVSSSGVSPLLVAAGQQLCSGTGMQQQPAPASAGGNPQGPLLFCAPGPPPQHGWVQVSSSGAQHGGAGLGGSQVLSFSTGGGIANTGTIIQQQGDASHWVVLGQATGGPPSIHQQQPQVTPLQQQQVLLLPADMQAQHQQPHQQQVLLLPADMQPQHQQQVLLPADMQHMLLPPGLGGTPDLSAPEVVLSMMQLQPQQMLPPQAQTILLHPHQQQPQQLHMQHNQQQQQLGYTQQQPLPEWLRQPPPQAPMQQQQQPVVWLQPPPPPPRRAAQPLPPPKQQQQQEQQQQSYTPVTPDNSLFFTGVSPYATVEDLLRVCAQYGHVKAIDLYRSYKGCRMSKGCGVVEYSARSEAGAALVAMHGRLLWPGSASPMVVEWYRHGARRHSRAGVVAGQQQQQQVALSTGADVGSGATFTPSSAAAAAAGVVAGAGAVGGSSDSASAAAAAAASGGVGAVEQPGQPAAESDSAAADTTHCPPPAACLPGSPTAPAPAPGAA